MAPCSTSFNVHINRRFLAARRFNADAALKQFQEALQFRREKHIVKLYDIVEITDFEQARQFVNLGFPIHIGVKKLTWQYSIHIGQVVETKEAFRYACLIFLVSIKRV